MRDNNDVDKLVICLIHMCNDERYMITSSEQDVQQHLEFKNAMQGTEYPT